MCDGEDDCRDGSDEDVATVCKDRTCLKEQFLCDGTRCISALWRCDGDKDCTDGSDEDAGLCASSSGTLFSDVVRLTTFT